MKVSELRNIIREEIGKVLNEATTNSFKYKLPHSAYMYTYDTGLPAIPGNYKIEVFGYNHKEAADALHKALTSSGFLEKYPLFTVRIDTMDGYVPTR